MPKRPEKEKAPTATVRGSRQILTDKASLSQNLPACHVDYFNQLRSPAEKLSPFPLHRLIRNNQGWSVLRVFFDGSRKWCKVKSREEGLQMIEMMGGFA